MSSSVKRIFQYDATQGKVVEVTDQRSSSKGSRVPALGAYSEARPLRSDSLGVMRHQVPEMREFVKSAGLTGVNVLDDGAVTFSCRGNAGRRGLLKLRGLVDKDGGYGDG